MTYPNFSVPITNTFTNGTLADATEVNTNYTDNQTSVGGVVNGATAVGVPSAYGMTPIGGIVAWHKTLLEKSITGAQTNTSSGTSQLIDSAADFVSNGVTAGMIVHNEDDNEFAIIETVTNLNTLVLVNDVNAGTADSTTFDLATGINYAIYATPELPDNWMECNGLTVSDADSPYNGVTLPSLNGTSDDTKRFLRGVNAESTGTTGGTATHVQSYGTWSAGSGGVTRTQGYVSANHINPYMEIVWIMRIK